LLPAYREAKMTLKVTPVFANEGDAGYDASFFGWAGH